MFYASRYKQDLYLNNMETIIDWRGGQKRIPPSIIQLIHQHAQDSSQAAQAAQVRVVTAQVKKQK
jgi:hypothetical protein